MSLRRVDGYGFHSERKLSVFLLLNEDFSSPQFVDPVLRPSSPIFFFHFLKCTLKCRAPKNKVVSPWVWFYTSGCPWSIALYKGVVFVVFCPLWEGFSTLVLLFPRFASRFCEELFRFVPHSNMVGAQFSPPIEWVNLFNDLQLSGSLHPYTWNIIFKAFRVSSGFSK